MITLSSPTTIFLNGSVTGDVGVGGSSGAYYSNATIETGIVFSTGEIDTESYKEYGGFYVSAGAYSTGDWYDSINQTFSVPITLPAGIPIDFNADREAWVYAQGEQFLDPSSAPVWSTARADIWNTLIFGIEVPPGVDAFSETGLLPISSGAQPVPGPATLLLLASGLGGLGLWGKRRFKDLIKGDL